MMLMALCLMVGCTTKKACQAEVADAKTTAYGAAYVEGCSFMAHDIMDGHMQIDDAKLKEY